MDRLDQESGSATRRNVGNGGGIFERATSRAFALFSGSLVTDRVGVVTVIRVVKDGVKNPTINDDRRKRRGVSVGFHMLDLSFLLTIYHHSRDSVNSMAIMAKNSGWNGETVDKS